MRKAFISIVIALCLLSVSSACASQALVDMLVYKDEDYIPGVTLEVLQLKDGMLLVGASEYIDYGWMPFLTMKARGAGHIRLIT